LTAEDEFEVLPSIASLDTPTPTPTIHPASPPTPLEHAAALQYFNRTCVANGVAALFDLLPACAPFVHAFVHAFAHAFAHAFLHAFLHAFVHVFVHAFVRHKHSATHGDYRHCQHWIHRLFQELALVCFRQNASFVVGYAAASLL
jgi:hypothetical protein